ncbi:MAG: hypothetical protein LBJ00_01920 [Planctomycetaceae bacterium]|nr:hypothetical protein [Planctomycetaceae bacterium]
MKRILIHSLLAKTTKVISQSQQILGQYHLYSSRLKIPEAGQKFKVA